MATLLLLYCFCFTYLVIYLLPATRNICEGTVGVCPVIVQWKYWMWTSLSWVLALIGQSMHIAWRIRLLWQSAKEERQGSVFVFQMGNEQQKSESAPGGCWKLSVSGTGSRVGDEPTRVGLGTTWASSLCSCFWGASLAVLVNAKEFSSKTAAWTLTQGCPPCSETLLTFV